MTQLQERVLVLLKQIDKLCQDNGIEYYLTAGSLIGAMRHKGFIPWDDDADIIMTRDNWEKFYASAKDNLPQNIVLNSQDDDAGLAMTANHYVDTSTTAVYRYDITNPEQNGIMIDVIIMDPVPDNNIAKSEYVDALTMHTELTVLPYQYSLRNGKSTHFIRNWTMSRILGLRKVLSHIDRNAFHHTEEESRYYVQRFAGSPHFWPKEYFGTPKYVPFEDTMLPIPQRAGDCLCIGYDDDWMYIPSGGPSKSTHEFCVRSLTVPGRLISEDFERRVDRKKLIHTYVKRKRIMVAQTGRKYRIAMESDRFLAEYIRLVYSKKDPTVYATLLEQGNFDGLEAYFEQYIAAQCTSQFLGSSALDGWLNWRRKCHPMLIDIGDDALHAVLCLLIRKQKLAWVGKRPKARKVLERPMPQPLCEMDSLYLAIRRAISAFECGEDTQCREIVAHLLPKHPENPFLWKLDLKERVRDGLSGQELLNATTQGLELFPDDPEILCLQAEGYFAVSEASRGLEIYQILAENTNHGLVLLHIKERLEALIERDPKNEQLYVIWLTLRKHCGEENVPAIEEFFPEKQSAAEANDLDPASLQEPVTASQILEKCADGGDALTPIQRKRFELLTEASEICKRNKIKYVLFGKTLLQAARDGRYMDKHGDIVLAMTSENCKKFTQAVKELGQPGRYLNSMAENPRFHRFCLQYCDSESLDFDVPRCGCGERFGLFITIEILRCPAKNKLANLIDQMLESGWESSLTMKWSSAKRTVSRLAITALCTVFGRKNVGKWLYQRFLKGPRKKEKTRYYLKSFWGKRTYYPSYWFKYTSTMELEGMPFEVMKLSSCYLKKTYGAKWKTRTFPATKAYPFTRITDASVSSQEYLAILKENHVDRMKHWALRRKANQKYAPVNTLGSKTGHYWDIMRLCGERYRLLEEYMPKREYIIELFRSNRIKELSWVLKDYYTAAIAFSKKGLGLCFDKKIFEILEYTLFSQGKVKEIRTLRQQIVARDWEPIAVTTYKGGGGMREALPNDIPAILVYLERNIQDCLYMYIDIGKYGLENDHMRVWLDSNEDGLKLVVMKYHTNISIYTDRDDWDAEAVMELIEQEQVNSVTAEEKVVKRLYNLCSGRYNVSYGSVFRFSNARKFEFDGLIEDGHEADTMDIAQLIAQDEGIGSYYEVEDLANQLSERIRTGMGRSFVIREKNKIVAHIASYAEFNGIATTGGLIVDPKYQNGLYGGVLESHLVHTLLQEDFQVYTFVTNRLRKKLLTAWGNTCVGKYGKMTRVRTER